jgi:hypothetical protein
MSPIDGHPYTGPFTFNLTALSSGILFDLVPGATQHMRREKPGIDDVLTELAGAVPNAGAVVPADAHARIVDRTERIAKIRKHRAQLDKMYEVLNESEAMYEDERENDISLIVDAVTSNARRKKDRSLLAPFEKTLAYNAQTANKAAKTRQRNAEAKKAAGKQPGNGGG